MRISNTYFKNTLFVWNLLDDDTKKLVRIAEFKRKPFAKIRPLGKPTYGIHDIKGVRSLTKLRLVFSVLNDNSFRHNFGCLIPIYNCGTGKEDNEYFFLHCPQFDSMHAGLFGQLLEMPALVINDMNTTDLCILLQYGSSQLNIVTKQNDSRGHNIIH